MDNSPLFLTLSLASTGWEGWLTYGQLHEVQRPAYEQQHEEVGQQKGPSTILVGSEGEAPDVTQPHCHRDAGQEELDWGGPLLPLHLLPKGHLERQGRGER